MPSEEEIARALFERGRGVHDARTWEEANIEMREWLLGHARAILALFAPILAEKERRDAADAKQAEFEAWLEDLAENPPPANDALKKLLADYEASGIKSLAAEASWERRALAAEAALSKERAENEQLHVTVRKAHVALTLACALPGVASEYDFSEAIASTEATLARLAAAIRGQGE